MIVSVVDGIEAIRFQKILVNSWKSYTDSFLCCLNIRLRETLMFPLTEKIHQCWDTDLVLHD